MDGASGLDVGGFAPLLVLIIVSREFTCGETLRSA